MISGFGLNTPSREGGGLPRTGLPEGVQWRWKAERDGEGHSRQRHPQRPEGVGVEKARPCGERRGPRGTVADEDGRLGWGQIVVVLECEDEL